MGTALPPQTDIDPLQRPAVGKQMQIQYPSMRRENVPNSIGHIPVPVPRSTTRCGELPMGAKKSSRFIIVIVIS
jgi:hypothetical protein